MKFISKGFRAETSNGKKELVVSLYSEESHKFTKSSPLHIIYVRVPQSDENILKYKRGAVVEMEPPKPEE